MKRYFLAMAILAAGAAGVVWIAIKERAAATRATAAKPATTAIAESSVTDSAARDIKAPVSASATPTPMDIPPVDGGPTADANAATPDGGQSFPPLAAYAAWSVVRWGMKAAEVDVALRQAGVTVLDATDPKTEVKRLRAKSGPWDVTIDFTANSPSEIVVTASNLSKEEAHAAVAKAKERAPATKTIDRAERHWKKEGGAVATLVTRIDGATGTMREEHVRETAPGGALGFAGLRWGMSTQEVVGVLTARGYVARVVKASPTGLDPCAVPQPALDCAKKSHVETVPFSKGDVEGTASFNQFGLRQVEISGPAVDGGAARAKELESSLGKPASVEVSTKTQHVDHGRMTSIEVEVTERRPGGFTVIETYRPKN
jgi:hypothetical protein